MTGKPPDELARRAIDGGTEIDLVRSGLEDTMRNSYEATSQSGTGKAAPIFARQP